MAIRRKLSDFFVNEKCRIVHVKDGLCYVRVMRSFGYLVIVPAHPYRLTDSTARSFIFPFSRPPEKIY
jgi:hypothetical protein